MFLLIGLLGLPSAYALPSAPTGLTASGGNGYIIVNFTKVGSPTGFKYQLSSDGGSTWTDAAFVSDVAGARDVTSPVAIFGMANGSYQVRLIANDGSGDSSPSTAASVDVGPKTNWSGTGATRNAFLMGTYSEVGVRRNGSFGSELAPPSGFHQNVGNCLGFRVDRDFDGWGNSTDDGDFFCPGTQYEGWQIRVGTTGSYFYNCHAVASTQIVGSLSEISSSDGVQSVKWTTTNAVSSDSASAETGITVTQIARVPDSSQVLHVDVTLTNTSASTLTDIFYGRSFDPDNLTDPAVYTSTNTVVSRESNAEVKSTWGNGSLIAMKSTSAGSRAARRDSGFGCNEDPKEIYNAPTNSTSVAGWTSTTTPNTADSGIGIAVRTASLGAGESTSFRISYVLSDNEANLPGAPTINSITPSNGALSVDFSAASNSPTNYDYSIDNGITWVTRDPASTSSPISVTGLTNGTTYTVKLRGRNSYGTGPVSNALTGTPSTSPSPPILDGLTSGNGSITVSLTPGADGGSTLTNYEYSLSADNSTWGSDTPLSPASTAQSFTISGLNNGTVYYVRVKARNANGLSSASNVLSTSTATAPSPPVISSIGSRNQALLISYTEGSSGGSPITGIQYSLDAGSTWESTTITSSPFLVSSLTNGTTYSIALRATNSIGTSSASLTDTGTPATVPAAPTLTSGSAVASSSSLTVTFTPGDNGGSSITDYEYSTDGGATWRLRSNSPSTNTSLTITTLSSDGTTSLANGQEYCVQIRAVNAIGSGDSSASACGTPATSPSAPTITSITSRNGSLEVAFTEGSNGGASITGYSYSLDAGSSWVNLGLNKTPFTIPNLVNGTSYSVVVRATNSVGDGAASTSVSGTPSTTPAAPTINRIIPSNTQLTVEFASNGDGGSAITNYQYSIDGGGNWITRSPSSTTSPLVISGLTNNTTYQIQLRAVNINGSGASTGTSIASTPRLIADAPTITSVTGGNTSLLVAFTAGNDNGDAITNYEYSVDDGSTWLVRTPTATTSPISILGLTNGTTYQVRLRAINSAGPGAQSSAVAGTPFTTPAAPVINSITAGNQSLSVAYTAGSTGGSSITNYQYSTNAGTNWTAFSPDTTSNPLVITGLTNGTAYSVKIRAVNAAGPGTGSNTVEGTPTNLDSTAPTFVSAAVNSTTLEMTYDETLSSTTAATSTFVVTIGGTTVSVSSVSINSTKVVLTLASGALYGQAVTVAYTDPTAGNDANAIQDTAGNDAATLTATSVTNNTPSLGILVPIFSEIQTTLDGFTFTITNYDNNWSFSLSATNDATASLAEGGLITVFGILNRGEEITVTVAASRLGYQTGSSSIRKGSTPLLLQPSYLQVSIQPSIKQEGLTIVCISGTFDFIRYGVTAEKAIVSSSAFTLNIDNTDVETKTTSESLASFEAKAEWDGKFAYCKQFAAQENARIALSSLNASVTDQIMDSQKKELAQATKDHRAALLSLRSDKRAELSRLSRLRSAETKSQPGTLGTKKAREKFNKSVELVEKEYQEKIASLNIKLSQTIDSIKKDSLGEIAAKGISLIVQGR